MRGHHRTERARERDAFFSEKEEGGGENPFLPIFQEMVFFLLPPLIGKPINNLQSWWMEKLVGAISGFLKARLVGIFFLQSAFLFTSSSSFCNTSFKREREREKRGL